MKEQAVEDPLLWFSGCVLTGATVTEVMAELERAGVAEANIKIARKEITFACTNVQYQRLRVWLRQTANLKKLQSPLLDSGKGCGNG